MSRWKRRARRAIGRLLPPRAGAVILGYHRLADPRTAVGAEPSAMCVSPKCFEAQMAELRRLGRPVSLRHLGATLAAGVSVRGMIAVTFDDGYEDVLSVALPVLERERIPATVFFVAGNAGWPFWWDRLGALLVGADPAVPFRVSVGASEFVWPGVGGAEQLRVRLNRVLRVLDEADRTHALDRLATVWGAEEPDLPRSLTLPEARGLVESTWIAAGAHTMSHPPLTEIPPRRARHEIFGARDSLRTTLESDVAVFSYPHGSVNARTIKLVREAGYDLACVSASDSIRTGAERLALPRLWARDEERRAFTRRMHRYLGRATGSAPDRAGRADRRAYRRAGG
jgi:peptidoglycan/xylan/chitin deacetylase (PgdA/CDA1 family)